MALQILKLQKKIGYFQQKKRERMKERKKEREALNI